jgi:hypothetical protein
MRHLPVLAFALCVAASCLNGLSQSTNESQTFGSYVWTAPALGDTHALGKISYIATPGASPQLVLEPEISAASGVLTSTSASWTTTGSSRHLTVTVEANSSPIHILITPSMTSGRLQAQITADKPGITVLDYGTWPHDLAPQWVAVPYYTSTVAYLGAFKSYANAWLSWHTTGSTALNGSQAQYAPLTDGRLLPLNEQLHVVISPEIGGVFPSPGNAVSPNLAIMNGRMVVDVWSGGFESIAQNLAQLGSYGVTNCLVIIHNWQRFGYDNALPDHYPANPEPGGEPGLKAATEEARAIGCLVAVHENYIDYYPNYDHFTPAAIALNSDGSRQLSWLNPETNIQSFATKPTWTIRNAQTESPVIHEHYGTTASFLDVLSAVGPGFHVDMDSSQGGAGLLTTRDLNSAALWAYLRQTHQGPIVGEGVNHWFSSGLLDGVEAQTGAGAVPSNLGTQVPLFVNFDLFDIHPFQVNHGMGYASRWTPTYGAFTSTAERDAYRMQEIAFGHAPFLDDSDFGDASRALVESALVTPVASRYGLATASRIGYQDKGSWTSASQAALTGNFDQVQITYNNGLIVTANRAPQPLAISGVTLPQYGWSAVGQGLTAYTGLCGATICDYARTPDSLFVNARNQSDIRVGSSLAAPGIAAFRQTGARAFNITYSWQDYRATSVDLTPFVHFVDPAQTTNEGIVFQGDYLPARPTSSWQVGQTIDQGPFAVSIPASVPDGVYSIRVGLYDPISGDRYVLAGQDDGDRRYIVGSIAISQNGAKIEFTPVPPPRDDPRLNAAGSVVEFPVAQTDGMFSLDQENGNWVLRPFPRFRNFTILIKSIVIAMPATVLASGGASATVTPVAESGYWKLPLNGASRYTWPVE